MMYSRTNVVRLLGHHHLFEYSLSSHVLIFGPEHLGKYTLSTGAWRPAPLRSDLGLVLAQGLKILHCAIAY